jgi:uncharacterized protein involved in exopolysaccharide biosynthesis
MELIEILRVIRRWLWLIIAIVVVTQLALWMGLRSAEPVYAATVSLQISTPQRENVAAYDEYRSISLRDEITVAINNLVELLEGEEVFKRTTSELGLPENEPHYTITARRASDADFVNVIVEAGTPTLAAEIANAHVSIAIAYYGELRAQSTKAEKGLFAEQLRTAENEFRVAEKALVDFRTENGIYSLESQLSTQQKLLEQLQLERDQRLLEQAITIIPTPIVTADDEVIPAIDSVAEVDKLIAQRLKELDQFTSLVPQYNVLEQNVVQARAVYQHLLGKYSEAVLKVTAVQAANFIQVIKPAYVPTRSESGWLRLAVLALAGSLGIGVMLAFILQYLYSFKLPNSPVSTHNQIAPADVDRKTQTQAQVYEVPWKAGKTSSRRQLDRELWTRLANSLRWNGSSYEYEGVGLAPVLAADQEPDVSQGKLSSSEINVA